MAVDRRMLNCVAFVGEGDFRPMGTGFFVFLRIEEWDFYYFVTAGHNVWPRRSKRVDNDLPTDPICLRVNRKQGFPKVLPTDRKQWIFPEDRFVDICALPIDLPAFDPQEELNISGLHLPSISFAKAHLQRGDKLEKIQLELGDELFIIGAFVNRIGTKQNIPVVRVCNLAAEPTEPIDGGSPRHPAYLIETRSLGGTSGSPVFMDVKLRGLPSTVTLGVDPTGRHQHYDVPYYLVGMVVGAHGGDYTSDFLMAPSVENGMDAEFNAGISVMLPVEQIEDFLDSPLVKGPRDAMIENMKKQSGYRPTSARPKPVEESARPPMEGDEQHAERFTALLDAAVGKPKQGG